MNELTNPVEAKEEKNGDLCPVCGYLNETPAGDNCEHFIAWVWDGKVECINRVAELAGNWSGLNDLVRESTDESDIRDLLDEESARSGIAKKLIQLAKQEASFEDVLLEVVSPMVGSGWSTEGMLGGAGYNIYLTNDSQLVKLADTLKEVIGRVEGKSEQ